MPNRPSRQLLGQPPGDLPRDAQRAGGDRATGYRQAQAAQNSSVVCSAVSAHQFSQRKSGEIGFRHYAPGSRTPANIYRLPDSSKMRLLMNPGEVETPGNSAVSRAAPPMWKVR